MNTDRCDVNSVEHNHNAPTTSSCVHIHVREYGLRILADFGMCAYSAQHRLLAQHLGQIGHVGSMIDMNAYTDSLQ